MTEVGLVKYDAMCSAIAACYSVDEVKELRDKARALQVYAQQAMNTKAEQKAIEIRIRAEKRAGKLIKEQQRDGQLATGKEAGPGRGKKGVGCLDTFSKKTLADYGISRDQSSQWQKLADIPDDEFEKAVKSPGATTEGMLRMAVHFSSDSAEWYTPPEIVGRVLRTLGEIDLDPCSNPGPDPIIPAALRFTREDDGLSREWTGRVYMNPPYGREIEAWVTYLLTEHASGRVPEAIALVPARVDTDWFHQLRDATVCFVGGRLKFSDAENSAPFPSAVAYLGERPEAFRAAFEDIGDIWGRNKQQHYACIQGSGKNELFTPERFIEAARLAMGGIDLDPASHEVAQRTVQAGQFFTEESNGLDRPWYGRVWLNPPYSQPEIWQFVKKLIRELRENRVTQAILLTHNYTDTTWFHFAQEIATSLCFTKGRIRFDSLDNFTAVQISELTCWATPRPAKG